jgi:CHAT domain-containing protein/Tfp pilus assembly protein PilF
MPREMMVGRLVIALWAFCLCLTLVVCAQNPTPPTAEEELAARIVAAPTEAERETLLNAATNLAIPKLVRALVAETDKQRDQGKYKEVLPLYAFAQNIAERNGDKTGAALALDRIGLIYFRLDDYPQALRFHEQSLTLREQLGDKQAVAETLDNLGRVYQWQNEHNRALEYFRRALRLSEESGDKKSLARTLHNIGSVYWRQGQFNSAEEHLQRSLQIKEELGDKEGIAITVTSMSGLAHEQSDYAAAAAHLQRALAIFTELGQKPRVGVVRGNLGLIYTELGNYEQALELFQQSLTVAETVGNRSIISSEEDRIGTIYFYQGDASRALEYYQKSLAEAEQLGVKSVIGQRLHNIAGVYDRQGDYDLALDYFQKALAQREAGEDRIGVAETLNRIARIYLTRGEYERALDYLRRSLAIYEELRNKDGLGQVALSLGDVQLAQKDLLAARVQYQRALQLFEESGVRRNAVTALNNLGETYRLQGDYAQALAHAERAALLARQTDSAVGLQAAHTTAGRALRALAEPARAEQSFIAAINATELLRERVAGGARERQIFFAESVAPYYEMVELLASQRRLGDALAYAERAKGRVLLDVLSSGQGSVSKSLTAAERDRERQLTNELFSLNAQLASERQRETSDAARVAELEAKLAPARRTYEDFENQLYASHSELRLQRGEARTLSLEQAATLLPDAQTALLEYVVMDDRAYLFVLARGGATNGAPANIDLRAYPIAVKRADLAKEVERFRRAIEERDLEFAAPARRFYDLLLAPARAQLQGKTNLIIVPDDALWSLPFQVLQYQPRSSGRNRYLIEDAAISYAPSLSVLYEIERLRAKAAPTRDATLLAFGNPALAEGTVARARTLLRSGVSLAPLPEAEAEVKALAQLYGAQRSRVYTGAEAYEGRVKQESGKFSVLHFATHGVFNDASPMYSHLVLAQDGAAGLSNNDDGLLEAWELMKLDLKADLVVLSACETARGRVGAGEGLIGLNWALFVAGSPTTVVSQWKVASGTTRQLMTDFHRNLKAGAVRSPARAIKSEALRAAALQMLRSSNHVEWRHPFYWAGFILVGAN